MGSKRDANLDLLRALAILLVLVAHVSEMWPNLLWRVVRYTELGGYGVDLFFVLSGWLVGGLYWKEQARSGSVDVKRFVLRRILRTVPCYLVALALAWGAVRVADPQRAAFDWRYLFFLQNYATTMPYFVVSWSLCIEEHFYLLMPIAMLLLCRWRPRWVPKLWPLCLLPILLRALRYHRGIGIFGPEWTQTHLRYEGLLLGLLAAWVARNDKIAWARLVGWSKVLVVPLLIASAAAFRFSWHSFYVVGLTLFSFGFCCLLAAMVGRETRPAAARNAIRWVAVGSYSCYLTHALMIHVSLRLINRWSISSELGRLAIFAVTILIGATAFYRVIERPLLAVRDALVPATGGQTSAQAYAGRAAPEG